MKETLEEEPNPFELPKALPDDVFYESLEEPKQETIEEAAERISKEHYVDQSDYWAIGVDSFKRGAKWQQERMYSEEEVGNIANWAFGFYKRNDLSDSELEDEFNRILVEQFKKK